MRKEAKQFYELSSEEIISIVKNGLIIFDANVLLNLYLYDEDTKNNYIHIFKKLKDKNRIWMPNQICIEFLKNRQHKATSLAIIYDDAEKEITNNLKKIIDNNQVKTLKDYIANINFTEYAKEIKKIENKIVDYISKHKKEIKNREEIDNDDIFLELEEIFKDKIGRKYSVEEILKISEEGEKRYALKIPPGFCDIGKKTYEMYNDLIIWKQIIEQAKMVNNDVIFVSNDTKKDWIEDKTKQIHKFLRQEFFCNTGKECILFNIVEFANTINTVEENSISEDSIIKTEKILQQEIDLGKKLEILNLAKKFYNNERLLKAYNIVEKLYDENVLSKALAPLELIRNNPHLIEIIKIVKNNPNIINELEKIRNNPNLIKKYSFYNNIDTEKLIKDLEEIKDYPDLINNLDEAIKLSGDYSFDAIKIVQEKFEKNDLKNIINKAKNIYETHSLDEINKLIKDTERNE